MRREGVAILGGWVIRWNFRGFGHARKGDAVASTPGFAHYHPDFAKCEFVVTIHLTDSRSLQETPPCQ
jgi:hypothetical protein